MESVELVAPRAWWLERALSARAGSRPSVVAVTQTAMAQHAHVDLPLSLLPLTQFLAPWGRCAPSDLPDVLDALHAVTVAATADPPLVRLDLPEVEAVLREMQRPLGSDALSTMFAAIVRGLTTVLETHRAARRRYDALRTCRRSRRLHQKRGRDEEGEWK